MLGDGCPESTEQLGARTTCLYNVNLWRSSEDYKHNFLCINLIKKNNNLDLK